MFIFSFTLDQVHNVNPKFALTDMHDWYAATTAIPRICIIQFFQFHANILARVNSVTSSHKSIILNLSINWQLYYIIDLPGARSISKFVLLQFILRLFFEITYEMAPGGQLAVAYIIHSCIWSPNFLIEIHDINEPNHPIVHSIFHHWMQFNHQKQWSQLGSANQSSRSMGDYWSVCWDFFEN